MNIKDVNGCRRYSLRYIGSKTLLLENIEKIIKKHPNLKLPPLENYPDYNEAIKIKNHLSYNLGEALIKANNKGFITGGGGIGCYLRLGA